MEWTSWEPLYQKVAKELDLNITKDYEIAEKYKNLIEENLIQKFSNRLQKIRSKKIKTVWIIGAGPSLEHDFEIYRKYHTKTNELLVGVDGACKFLLEQKFYPDIIFSDLDGSIEAIIKCLKHGSIIFLHAHGDNFNLIENSFQVIKEFDFIPTVQTKPVDPFLFNFGGFTDGDRAISTILSLLKSCDILLLGFTFGKIQGKYSKPNLFKNHEKASNFKLKKLQFAKEYIELLATRHQNQIFNLSTPTDSINNVPENYKDFKTI